jgi:hypothetical protein
LQRQVQRCALAPADIGHLGRHHGRELDIDLEVARLTATDAPLLRITLPVNEASGLVVSSWAQIDKIITISRRRIGGRIGHLDNVKLFEISQALLVFLGTADAAGH